MRLHVVSIALLTRILYAYATFRMQKRTPQTGRMGGTMTGCLNAANEEANQLFRDGAFG